jgi:hypothetical protein
MRRVIEIAPKGERIRAVICMGNEFDDIHALALAILSQDRLEIEGFVGSHMGDEGGMEGPGSSAREIERFLELVGMEGRYPIAPGSHPMQYAKIPSLSEGVDLLLEILGSGEGIIWVVLLGPATDIASAYLLDPRIKDKAFVLWDISKGFIDGIPRNVRLDLKAAKVLMESEIPILLFDAGSEMICPMTEAEVRIGGFGPVGKYLLEKRKGKDVWRMAKYPRSSLGAMAFLINPSIGRAEVEEFNSFMDRRLKPLRHIFGNDWIPKGPITTVSWIDRDRAFLEFYRKLDLGIRAGITERVTRRGCRQGWGFSNP